MAAYPCRGKVAELVPVQGRFGGAHLPNIQATYIDLRRLLSKTQHRGYMIRCSFCQGVECLTGASMRCRRDRRTYEVEKWHAANSRKSSEDCDPDSVYVH